VGKHSNFRAVTMSGNIGQVRKWGKFPHFSPVPILLLAVVEVFSLLNTEYWL
jgi:hypothetical protein